MRSCAFCLFLILACLLHAEILTVAAYNINNYLSTDRMVDGAYRQNYPKPEKEKAALVEVIKSANPDILALEEMGTSEYFDEFQSRLKKEGLDYPYATLMQGADPVRHTAVLSKIPFETNHYSNLDFSYLDRRVPALRGLLEVRFAASKNSPEWKVYVVHLKSKLSERPDDPDSKVFRVGEATAMREQILRSCTENGAYLVMGDFNDGPKSSTLKRFLTKGGRQLTEMVNALDSRNEDWTQHWASHGEYSRIDFILASSLMESAIVPCSPKIMDTDTAPIASDHRMIIAKIDTSKIGSSK